MLEHQTQPVTYACRVLPRQGHHVPHVRKGQCDHQAMHVDPTPAEHGLRHAEIHLRLARMPLKLHETLRRQPMLLPPVFHITLHHRIRTLETLFRDQPVKHPPGGMPLLAGHEPVTLKPLIDHGSARVQLRRPLHHPLRFGRAILLPRVFRDRVARHVHPIGYLTPGHPPARQAL
jgi:hypothetical protein